MDSRIWGKGYLSNPFPYLIGDITKVKEQDLTLIKSTFKSHYTKYKLFKDKETKQLGSSAEPFAKLEHKQQEEVTKIQESIAGGADIKKFTMRPQQKKTRN